MTALKTDHELKHNACRAEIWRICIPIAAIWSNIDSKLQKLMQAYAPPGEPFNACRVKKPDEDQEDMQQVKSQRQAEGGKETS